MVCTSDYFWLFLVIEPVRELPLSIAICSPEQPFESRRIEDFGEPSQ